METQAILEFISPGALSEHGMVALFSFQNIPLCRGMSCAHLLKAWISCSLLMERGATEAGVGARVSSEHPEMRGTSPSCARSLKNLLMKETF